MAGKLGTLTLDLIAKIGGFTGPMDKASKKTKQFSDDAKKYGKAAGAAIGAGAVVAATGLALIISKQLELIDQQAKAAQLLDTTYNSMANLKRAGELGGIGLDRITAAGRQLNLNIGEAIQGTDAQVEAFARLKLSAQEIYDLPLDERIATINKALIDNVQASERAAVAADIYGAKNAKAIQLLDPDTIAEAARQVEIFGLNLSDVDAAKVEMAGDAMSTFSLLADGAAKQLTVELAPILQATGEGFLDAAEEAGGLGTVVQDTTRKVVQGIAFIADAGDGVGRVLSTVAATLVGVYATAVADVNSLSAAVAEGLSILPDFAGGSEFAKQSKEYGEVAARNYSIAEQALQKLRDNLEQPLAGEKLLAAYDALQVSADAAAEASVEGRKLVAESGAAFVDTEVKKEKAAKKTVDPIQSQISALERAAKVWGLTSDEVAIYSLRADGASDAQLDYAQSLLDTVAGFEAAKKAGDDYADLVSDLRTEEEKRSDTLREQLAIIDSMQGLQASERDEVIGRAASAAFDEAPSFDGGDSAASGPLGELSKLDDAEDELNTWYETQLEALNGFRSSRADLNATWDEQERALKQQHEDSLASIERARWQTGLAATSEFLTQIQGLRDSDSKKGKAAAKAAAIVQATINAYTAATGAYASASAIPVVGWVLGPVAAAAALAAGLANVAAIKGQAHDGIMSVPNSGTWNLEKGERVLTAQTSATMDKTLADIQAGQSGGAMGRSPVTVTQNIQVQGRVDRRTSSQIATDTSRKQRQAQARFGG